MVLAGCSRFPYQYTIEVDNADRHYVEKKWLAKTGPLATVTVAMRGPGAPKPKTRSVAGAQGATTFQFSETHSVLMPVPYGIVVKVEKEGYKPWTAEYGWSEFVLDDDSVARRIDIVSLEPVSSTQPSTTITTAPERGYVRRDYRYVHDER